MKNLTIVLISMCIAGLVLVATSCNVIEEMPLIKQEEKPEFLVRDCEVGLTTPMLKVALLHPPLTFNPVTAMDDVSRFISSQLTSGLYRYNPVSDRFEPALARGYNRDAENKVFTVQLRRNIVFSNGIEFSAEDVIQSLDYIIKQSQVKTPLKVYFQFAGQTMDYTMVDDQTIRLTFAESVENIEPILTKIIVLPREQLQEAAQQNRLRSLYDLRTAPDQIPSIGPFVIQRFAPDENRLTLARNPNFWVVDASGRQLPYLNEVVVTFTNTSSEISMKFRTGESDVIDGIPAEDAARLANVRGLNIMDVGPSTKTVVAWLNQSRKTDPQTDAPNIARWQFDLFNEAAFRAAMNQAVNKENIIQTVFSGMAQPATGLTPFRERLWYAPVDTPTPLNALLQTLREMGLNFNRGSGLPATFGRDRETVAISISILSGDETAEKVGNAVVADLAEIGVRATLLAVPYDVFYDELSAERPNYQMVLLTISDLSHPFFQREVLQTGSIRHYWFTEQAVPETPLEEQLNAASDSMFLSRENGSKYQAAQDAQRIMGNGSFMIPLVNPNGLYGAKGKIQNIRVNFRCPSIMWNLEELYSTGE